jgi:O-antigen ligase
MRASWFVPTLALAWLVALAAVLVGDGHVGVALLPFLGAAAAWALCCLPLRYPLLLVTFLALTLENPSDTPASGLWKSPLYGVGTALLAHLNLLFPTQSWLFFSGLDVVLLAFVGVVAVRLGRLSREQRARELPATPMRLFALISLGGACFMWLWGFVQGGSDVASSLWQMQRVVYLPIWCILFLHVLRGPGDRAALAKVLVGAACLKAVVALYVRATVAPVPPATVLDYATTHADSMLFAGAFCVVVALLLGGLRRGRVPLVLVVLPLLVAGMVANHRRVVWVELFAGLLTVYGLAAPSRPKRAISRLLVAASPVGLLYVVLGWGASSGLFGPVQVLRSIVDSTADPSTAWRDWENYNLFYTIRQSPLLGIGYGHEYTEIVRLPDISESYGLYRFIPHNSILGLWAYGGLVGFAALWAMMFVGVFLAVRAARYASSARERTAAISAAAAIVVYLVHCYGDMGLGTWTSIFMVAPAFAVASELAVATGAWRKKTPSRAVVRVANPGEGVSPIAVRGAS